MKISDFGMSRDVNFKGTNDYASPLFFSCMFNVLPLMDLLLLFILLLVHRLLSQEWSSAASRQVFIEFFSFAQLLSVTDAFFPSS